MATATGGRLEHTQASLFESLCVSIPRYTSLGVFSYGNAVFERSGCYRISPARPGNAFYFNMQKADASSASAIRSG